MAFRTQSYAPVKARSAAAAAAILAVVFTAAPVRSQQEGGRSAPDRPAAPLVSLEFPGGTALEYVEAVRRATGSLNVMVAPEAANVRVPPVTLRRVTRQAALDLLTGREVRTIRHAIELKVRAMPTYEAGEEPTFQVFAEVHGDQPHIDSRVWTVRGLVDGGISSQAILSAVELALEMTGAAEGGRSVRIGGDVVELALEMTGAAEGPDVRFHQDTALLMARGAEEHLAVIEQVVARLAQAKHEKAASEAAALAKLAQAKQEQSASEIAALRAAVQRQEARIAELEQMVQVKEAELLELRNRLQPGQTRDERPGSSR